MGHVATTEGVKGEDVRDLMVAAVEQRFGPINRLPATIEWLTDNGSCYVAGKTRRFAREIGFEPLTTPVESPQSNGMAEAFVRTIKRDYVRVNPTPDAQTVMQSLPKWFDHYNQLHPHRALGYRSPREFIADRSIKRPWRPCPEIKGRQHVAPPPMAEDEHADLGVDWAERATRGNFVISQQLIACGHRRRAIDVCDLLGPLSGLQGRNRY